MKKELLAPAGNMECLKQAVHNGADAVYLAGKLYGARKFANNFTNEELVDAVKYAHLYDVKVRLRRQSWLMAMMWYALNFMKKK